MFKIIYFGNNLIMKRLFITLSLILALCGIAVFGIINHKNSSSNSEYLRIHIRANSNSETDQKVKYEVRDAVVEAMIPFLSDCKTKSEAESTIEQNFSYIETVANEVLFRNGFSYTAKARLANEEFPTRSYDGVVFEQGFYDALILDLGTGEGNNWWCVVYPPLCFLKSNATGKDVVYKSKLVEIIESFFS